MKNFERLNKNEMKMIVGGSGSGTCAVQLPPNTSLQAAFQSDLYIYDHGTVTIQGISKEQALSLTNGVSGAHWCCDSCQKASWLN